MKKNNRLHLACDEGSVEDIKKAIDAGANVNAKDNFNERPLHKACYKAKGREMAQLLIDAGADVNAKDDDGERPLHFACRWASREMVQLLIDAGADVNAKDNSSETPLFLARNEDKHPAIIQLLLDAGATE